MVVIASFTLSKEDTFPNGTSVSAYALVGEGRTPTSGAPPGSAVASGTVSGGSVTFAGLADSTRYFAYAASPDRYVRFSTPPPETAQRGSGSGLPSTVVSKTTTYTAAAGELVKADATSAGFTVTLPAAPATGALVAVKKIDSSLNVVTIAPSGGGTIDGQSTAMTATQWAGAVFEHVGSNVWLVSASMSTTGPAGTDGVDGTDGVGVPAGGTTGQVLAKASGTDFDTEWADETGGSGSGSITKLRTNCYIAPASALVGNNLSASVGEELAAAIEIPTACTATKIGVNITQAGGTGAKVRLGIRADDGTMFPGTLDLDAGQVDATATGYVELTISHALTAGLYWVTATAQVAGGGLLGCQFSPLQIPAPDTNVLKNYPVSGFSGGDGSRTGALPSAFVSGTTYIKETSPRVLLKVTVP